MPDRFTKVTTTSYGSRVGQSFGGVIIGLLFFFGSFVVLFWNEGRADVSLIAQTAIEINANEVSSEADGQLVSTTGQLTTTETLGDAYLKPGQYIALKRTVEMYAWVEETEEETTTQTGGSEVTETTYTYNEEWTESPADSSSFEYPENHTNPAKTIDSAEKTVAQAKVGIYDIDADGVTLPSFTSVALSAENAIVPDDYELTGNYIFHGEGALDNPVIGDLRISYSVLNSNQEVTIFGELNQQKISAYSDTDNNYLYRVFTESREEAISTLHTEHVLMTWVLRAIGFILMWLGLTMIVGPISTLLDVLPFLGRLSRGLVSVIAFVASIILSLATIFISMIVHNLVALIITIVIILVIVVVVVLLLIKRKKSKSAASL